ncbi:hypothetical protein HNR23_003780 [Nocardiopsis mwathae]|uniref:Sugar phosphotransferase n=1 Tax=Nocardiopsis mwathae TaxID=1472723 RepID=A0A7X0D6X1_9ACTN|nr:stealth family protein [Nocardiopsis mwathae]MBB6173720.1 hypothetical protein [Nocardiopsis mwathae]
MHETSRMWGSLACAAVRTARFPLIQAAASWAPTSVPNNPDPRPPRPAHEALLFTRPSGRGRHNSTMGLQAKRSHLKRALVERAWRMRASARRQALFSGDPALREVSLGDQVVCGRVVERFTAAEAAARNLGLVVDACDAVGISYFLVPGTSRVRHTVGVNMADRDRLLAAMEERHADSGAFIGRPRGADRLIHAALFADGGLPKAVRDAAVVRVGEVLLGPAGQVVAGADLACDVEFWRDGAAVLAGADGQQRLAELQLQAAEEVFSEALVAPRRNRVSDVVPPSEQKPAWVRVRERDVATFQPFTELTVDDVDFPIDVVYTWVDGDEPAMREKRNRYRTGGELAEILDKETNESRYTSHDELRYSLRSVWMYAPFVRNIYVVTDGQVPRWLDTSVPGVRVVDHREIFPEGVLPVFNSHAIETRLHHIPGLSEHYLYFNDDVFVGRPVTPQHFFQGSGIMRVPMSPLKIGLGDAHSRETATNAASKNVRRLLKGEYGRFTTNNFMHTPLPQRQSYLHELEERFPADFDRTMRSRFRSPEDIAVTAPLHYNHALMAGYGMRGSFKFRYVNISRDDAESRLTDLTKNRRFDFFCVNDVDVPQDMRESVHKRIGDFLDEYFPFPSPFERDSA